MSLRILSLLPSATEIVCALGLEEQMVGRSHECDWPPSVAALPVCTEASVDSSRSSAAIDAQVRELLLKALSLYTVRTDVLAELAPTLVVTQTQCEVCAVSLAEVERAVAQSIGASASVVALSATNFDGVLEDIERVAAAAGVEARGDELVTRLCARMEELVRKTASRRTRPRVAAIEWLDPLMTAGNWVPELIEYAAGEPLLARAGEHSPWTGWDELAAADPDLIVAMPCGFSLERTLRELESVRTRSEWTALRAVREGKVYVVDANHYFSRPGPRLVESAEIVAEILDDACADSSEEGLHRGRNWRRVS